MQVTNLILNGEIGFDEQKLDASVRRKCDLFDLRNR